MLSVHDAFGNYLEVSAECQAVTGWSQDALLGSSGADYVHTDDVPVMAEAYERAVRERRPMYLVCRTEGREGYAWVASRFHAEEDDQGMYMVAATQQVPAPNGDRAWFRAADEGDAKGGAPKAPSGKKR